jgi:AbrB family looped-hinge helix DNA binding protein
MQQFVAKITRGGQVTIPSQVRSALGLRIGDSVVFSIDGNQLKVEFVAGNETTIDTPIPEPRETVSGVLVGEELRRQP